MHNNRLNQMKKISKRLPKKKKQQQIKRKFKKGSRIFTKHPKRIKKYGFCGSAITTNSVCDFITGFGIRVSK